jgi:nucleoside-diphosphate-sugar epimerase
LLIVGCGDVGLRVAKLLHKRWRVWVLTSSPHRVPALRALGLSPIVGNLDDSRTLYRVACLAPRVLHLAPPAGEAGCLIDTRTRHLVRALARGGVVRRVVYASTSGVYGDAQGDWVDESRAVKPRTDRARRRVDAEAVLRRYGHVHGVCVSLLRVPGIYALDRPDGNPLDRLRAGVPVPAEATYTNRIHADDLAKACVAALLRGAPGRAYHVSDDGHLPLAESMDLLAHKAGLPKPERLTMAQAREQLSPMTLSFWSESRRLRNDRMKRELRVVLRYPTLADAF